MSWRPKTLRGGSKCCLDRLAERLQDNHCYLYVADQMLDASCDPMRMRPSDPPPQAFSVDGAVRMSRDDLLIP